jgi:hypothetical protein
MNIVEIKQKTHQDFLDTDLFKYYTPDLRKIKNIQTEEQLYKSINLTKAEISEIQGFLI